MADIDPDTLLEWLTMGTGEERDMQIIALEQLCMLLLMSDNVDRCFERWVFICVLQRVFFIVFFEFSSPSWDLLKNVLLEIKSFNKHVRILNLKPIFKKWK